MKERYRDMMAQTALDENAKARTAALIMETESVAPRRRPRPLRVAIAAACICLMLAGTAIAAVRSGVFIRTFDGTGDLETGLYEADVTGGYSVEDEVRGLYPVALLPQQVLDDAAKGDYVRLGFDSRDAAEEYLGMELFDSAVLDGAEKMWETSTHEDGTTVEGYCHVSLFSGGDGIPDSITVAEGYRIGSVTVNVWTDIVTDTAPSEDALDSIYLFTDDQEDGLVYSGYTTPSGIETEIVTRYYETHESDLVSYSAYVATDTALTAFDVVGFESGIDPETGEERLDPMTVLKQILDSVE